MQIIPQPWSRSLHPLKSSLFRQLAGVGWEQCASIPEIAEHEVHVWRLNLAARGGGNTGKENPLSQSERDRATRFCFERDRTIYVRAHTQMRRLLASYLKLAPACVPIVHPAGRKPFLENGSDISFNLSHSGSMGLLAIARRMEVGVDLESVPTAPRAYPIDQLSMVEQADLKDACDTSSNLSFLLVWTRKEALLKGVGLGLSGSLSGFSVSSSIIDSRITSVIDPKLALLRKWALFNLIPSQDYIGALATDRAPLRICTFEYNEDHFEHP